MLLPFCLPTLTKTCRYPPPPPPPPGAPPGPRHTLSTRRKSQSPCEGKSSPKGAENRVGIHNGRSTLTSRVLRPKASPHHHPTKPHPPSRPPYADHEKSHQTARPTRQSHAHPAAVRGYATPPARVGAQVPTTEKPPRTHPPPRRTNPRHYQRFSAQYPHRSGPPPQPRSRPGTCYPSETPFGPKCLNRPCEKWN